MTAEPVLDPDILSSTYADVWRKMDRRERDRLGILALATTATAIHSERPNLSAVERTAAEQEADRYCDQMMHVAASAMPALFQE